MRHSIVGYYLYFNHETVSIFICEESTKYLLIFNHFRYKRCFWILQSIYISVVVSTHIFFLAFGCFCLLRKINLTSRRACVFFSSIFWLYNYQNKYIPPRQWSAVCIFVCRRRHRVARCVVSYSAFLLFGKYIMFFVFRPRHISYVLCAHTRFFLPLEITTITIYLLSPTCEARV